MTRSDQVEALVAQHKDGCTANFVAANLGITLREALTTLRHLYLVERVTRGVDKPYRYSVPAPAPAFPTMARPKDMPVPAVLAPRL